MKFEDSGFEQRYNAYWNKQVVPAYRSIFDCRFFSKTNQEMDTLYIQNYFQAVINILNNVTRQFNSGLFQDKSYVHNYIEKIKKEAINDLDIFRKKMEKQYGNNSPIVNYIQQCREQFFDKEANSHHPK